ncbi:hypothetical protein D9758_005716 [Tetrapyrgos nigripes]|uniref:C3H1-type domain-containing protein n=1 Tax=Tetrapyrgos nigripes TaxID=182062 RepID=A0A8H5GJR2_9AGAR|nr:hypothetical protein D9758_005716 [Tetrapyrgos nigripes]
MTSYPTQDTYARLLLHHKLGYPLWLPEPNQEDRLRTRIVREEDINNPRDGIPWDIYRNSTPPEYSAMGIVPNLYAEGIRIGDVGLATKHGFVTLFNIFLPENDPVNTRVPYGVPPGFATLKFHRDQLWTADCHTQTPIYSKHTREIKLAVDGTALPPGAIVGPGVGVEVHFLRSRGAALLLPEGAYRVDYDGLPAIRDYVVQNVESWYQYFERLGTNIDVYNGDIYIITGYDKTHSYENMSFQHHSGEASISLRVASPILANGDLGKLAMSFSSSTMHTPSTGASRPEHRLKNLSVFIRGYKIMFNHTSRLFSKKRPIQLRDVTDDKSKNLVFRGDRLRRDPSSSQGSSGSHPALSSGGMQEEETQYPSDDSSDSESRGSSILDSEPDNIPNEAYHPSNIINSCMLETHPDASAALTHDKDWFTLVEETDEEFPSENILKTRLKERYQTSLQQGLVYLVGPSTTRNPSEQLAEIKLAAVHAIDSGEEEKDDDKDEDISHFDAQKAQDIPVPQLSSASVSADRRSLKEPGADIALPTPGSVMGSAFSLSPAESSESEDARKRSLRTTKGSLRVPIPAPSAIPGMFTPPGSPSPSSPASPVESLYGLRERTAPNIPMSHFDDTLTVQEGKNAWPISIDEQNIETSSIPIPHLPWTQYMVPSQQSNGGMPSPDNTAGGSGPSANNRKLGLYKTELCRSWEEKGSCRYGSKCQFAHGEEELREVAHHPKYKTEICRTFWVSGSCPYGKRCCFIHTELPSSAAAVGGQPPADSVPPPSSRADGHALSKSTNSDPNDASGLLSKFFARISAKRTQDQNTETSSTPVETLPPGFPFGSRPPTGTLRVNTSVLDGSEMKQQYKSAYPTFANNSVLLPAQEQIAARSPAPVTAGPDFGRHNNSRLEIVGYNQRMNKAGTPSGRHAPSGSEDLRYT